MNTDKFNFMASDNKADLGKVTTQYNLSIARCIDLTE